MSNYLVTTAIIYPNDKPHIGHMYESILSDIINRMIIVSGNNSKLLTGTDEHGKKIQQKAMSLSITPNELCDQNSQLFKDILHKSEIKYSRFIRTSDQDHEEIVKESIVKSFENIEPSLYSGYYNIREETFVTETEASLTDYKDPVTGIPYEVKNEATYNFKLSNYRDFIIEKLNKVLGFNTDSFMDRILDLRDLSISRIISEDFNCGIEFPLDNTHIVYVWFDALLNYITGLKSEYNITENVKSIHVIGKDIVWFHSVIYPAILSSCGYPIYDTIFVHGFIVDKDGNKMSKSLGNVVDPNELLSKYPIEAIRFYFFFETGEGNDIKFNEERMMELYNSILVNGFYNLFSRFYKLISDIDDYPFHEISLFEETPYEKIVKIKLEDCYDFHYLGVSIVDLINKTNELITVQKPWTMNEGKREFMIRIGYFFFNILCLLSAVIPEKVKELNSYLGFNIHGIIYDHPVIYSYDSSLRTYEKKSFKIKTRLKIGENFSGKK